MGDANSKDSYQFTQSLPLHYTQSVFYKLLDFETLGSAGRRKGA